VYAIARYKFLDYLRRTKASTSDVPLDLADEITVHDDSAHVESSLDLEKLLAEVPPKARQAIQFVKLDGLSVREAAAKSGMSESAVKISVHRGLKALATFINKERRS
jgi:RNA polymerase sigma-70 factor (ECF subfamily)